MAKNSEENKKINVTEYISFKTRTFHAFPSYKFFVQSFLSQFFKFTKTHFKKWSNIKKVVNSSKYHLE